MFERSIFEQILFGFSYKLVFRRHDTQHKDIKNNEQKIECNTQHNNSVVMLSVTKKPFMLRVIMLNAVMLSVVLPACLTKKQTFFCFINCLLLLRLCEKNTCRFQIKFITEC
jgi:hypothetical protein